MIIRALDTDGDWTFGKGRNNYLSGNAAIGQDIECRVRSYLGNCFFAQDQGIDWFNLVGSKNKVLLELSVRTTILGTDGVQSIVNAQVDFNTATRKITMTYAVTTIFTLLNQTAPLSGTSSYLLTDEGDILTTESGQRLVAG